MLMKLSQRRNKKGFTLVELIVVIAILGILVAIAVPRFSGFQEKAKLSADKASATSIGKAIELYAMDNDDLNATLVNADYDKLKEAGLFKDVVLKAQSGNNLEFVAVYSKNDSQAKVSFGEKLTVGGKEYQQLYPAIAN